MVVVIPNRAQINRLLGLENSRYEEAGPFKPILQAFSEAENDKEAEAAIDYDAQNRALLRALFGSKRIIMDKPRRMWAINASQEEINRAWRLVHEAICISTGGFDILVCIYSRSAKRANRQWIHGFSPCGRQKLLQYAVPIGRKAGGQREPELHRQRCARKGPGVAAPEKMFTGHKIMESKAVMALEKLIGELDVGAGGGAESTVEEKVVEDAEMGGT